MSTHEPPPLRPAQQSRPAASALAILLSLVLLLFLVTGVCTLLSESLNLFFGRTDFAEISGLTMLLLLLAGLPTYVLLAFRPGIPKRFFLPISLWVPVATVASLPLLIYFFEHAALIGFTLAFVHVLVALFIIRRVRGGEKFGWPLVPEQALAGPSFRWGNFLGVLLAGVLLVLPAIVLGGVYSAHLAVDHFTDGFVALRPAGITVQVRKYVRDDGKRITLVPMSHIGEPKFYHDLAASFPPDSVILMEGVTDSHHVINQHIDYGRAAAAVGGVEQVKVFRPPGELVAADVDVSNFSPGTLELLKIAMLVHAKGLTPETLPLLTKPMPPGFEKQLIADLLTMRNEHLLSVLQQRLSGPGQIIVPWGAAHQPQIAREIQKLGFRLIEKQEFLAISFGSGH